MQTAQATTISPGLDGVGSTYASNGVARNRHAIWKISRAAYRPGNTLFRDGAGWGTDDSDARNRPDMAHPVRLENAKQK